MLCAFSYQRSSSAYPLDRTFDDQRLRAGGLNLVVAAIVLWNTVYLERAVETLRAGGTAVPDELLQHLSPLAWEHIILTGEYRWGSDETRQPGQRRELRPAEVPYGTSRRLPMLV